MILRILVFVLIGTTAFSILGCVDIIASVVLSILGNVSIDEQVKESEKPHTFLNENLKETTLNLNEETLQLNKTALHLKAEVEPKVVELGGELHIRLIITNTTDEAQNKGLSFGCEFGYSLWDKNGEIVAPPPYECRHMVMEYQFPPGQSVKDFTWVLDDEEIKPGIYQLVVGFGPRGEEDSAPPIEIEIR